MIIDDNETKRAHSTQATAPALGECCNEVVKRWWEEICDVMWERGKRNKMNIWKFLLFY